ncbi:MAG: hypothetical protein ACYSUQ_04535 [Planctomycetota bacterium]|jgi:hypothetical protein
MRRVLAIGAVALFAAGCHRPLQPGEPTAQQAYVADEAGFDRLWASCQEVLRRHRFRLDRVDRRSGTITTLPETSQSFFEFWRHDVDTAFDLMEATMRTVRRKATVQVDREAADPTTRVAVTVQRETFATPERQFNSSAAALRVFGEELPGVSGEPYLSRADDYWIDDGRDGAMEQRMLDRILRHAAIPTTPTVVWESTRQGAGGG